MTSEFQTKLAVLMAKELYGDAETIVNVIERLTYSLGLAIAVSCRGDMSQADTMMAGAEGYLAECVTNNAKLAAFMAMYGKKQSLP